MTEVRRKIASLATHSLDGVKLTSHLSLPDLPEYSSCTVVSLCHSLRTSCSGMSRWNAHFVLLKYYIMCQKIK